MATRTATIGSSVGLHARPAAIFAAAVDATGLDVTIECGGEEADAASVLEIMTLGASHGDVVTLTADGENAEAVLDSLVALLARDLDAE
jgi:phosphotransferase system HPr (HPr) family protein